MMSSLLFQGKEPKPESVIVNRILYIYNLKASVDRDTWKGFASKKYDLPLVYYTDSFCYIGNPTGKFLKLFSSDLIFENKELKIYKTRVIDAVPFHMENSMTFGKGSSSYNHRSPFMNCSSLEITKKFVPDVNSTEQWATMIIHEYFHGFQFRHEAHLNFFEKNIAMSSDTLRQIYKANDWYKKSVDEENRLLMAAISSADGKQARKCIDSFFVLRNQRRRQAVRELKTDVTLLERSYETMEGTARYVEYSLYAKFAQKKPDRILQESDSSYHSYRYFQDYHIGKDKWLYLSEAAKDYFYSTGFNLVRLLEKLKIDYQSRVFKEGGLTLEQILQQSLKNAR